ncbi:MAG TPA: branched-chain amino acid ABC transporter permease [Abditibacteriaceae bacterium]|jgi:branched-chain amino acid transport system permease protein
MTQSSHFPLHTWPLRLVVAALVAGLLYALQSVTAQIFNAYILDLIMLAGISIILAVSLNLINGVTGQFSLGHAGFMALGAYAAAVFTRDAGPRLDLPMPLIFLLSILLAAVVAGVAGFLVGLPSLRLRGDYLAIVTLGFAQIIISIIITIPMLGEALGMIDSPLRADGSPDTDFQAQIQTNFVWLFSFVALCWLMMRNLALSHWGRAMQAVREDEIAAEASGINTTQTKVLAFVISSLWAGIAGGLYAHYNHSVVYQDYSFVRSVEIVVMVVLGGLGSITGSTIAAVLLRFMDAALRSVNGVFIISLILALSAAALAYPTTQKVGRGLKPGRWFFTYGAVLFGLALLWLQGRHLIESPDTPGKAEDWLRYVIYALILIVMMILRPQGLLGRSELGWHLLRKRQNPAQNET